MTAKNAFFEYDLTGLFRDDPVAALLAYYNGKAQMLEPFDSFNRTIVNYIDEIEGSYGGLSMCLEHTTQAQKVVSLTDGNIVKWLMFKYGAPIPQRYAAPILTVTCVEVFPKEELVITFSEQQ